MSVCLIWLFGSEKCVSELELQVEEATVRFTSERLSKIAAKEQADGVESDTWKSMHAVTSWRFSLLEDKLVQAEHEIDCISLALDESEDAEQQAVQRSEDFKNAQHSHLMELERTVSAKLAAVEEERVKAVKEAEQHKTMVQHFTTKLAASEEGKHRMVEEHKAAGEEKQQALDEAKAELETHNSINAELEAEHTDRLVLVQQRVTELEEQACSMQEVADAEKAELEAKHTADLKVLQQRVTDLLEMQKASEEEKMGVVEALTTELAASPAKVAAAEQVKQQALEEAAQATAMQQTVGAELAAEQQATDALIEQIRSKEVDLTELLATQHEVNSQHQAAVEDLQSDLAEVRAELTSELAEAHAQLAALQESSQKEEAERIRLKEQYELLEEEEREADNTKLFNLEEEKEQALKEVERVKGMWRLAELEKGDLRDWLDSTTEMKVCKH